MFDGNCQKSFNTYPYFTLQPSETPLQWSQHIYWNFETKNAANYEREDRLLFLIIRYAIFSRYWKS